MKGKKRPTLDFTSIANEGMVPRVVQTESEVNLAPPPEAELDMVDAPPLVFDLPHGIPEPAASLAPPAPVQPIAPTQEPPLPPAVLATTLSVKEPSAAPIWIGACVLGALIAGAPVAYAIGFRKEIAPFPTDPFAIGIFAFMTLGLVSLVLVAAFLLRQGQKLSVEIRRTRHLAETMVAPAAMAAQETEAVVGAIRREIDQASASALEARETLLALREALAEETDRLAKAASEADRTSTGLAETLGRQRDALASLSGELDQRSATVADTISLQAKMVAEASDLAETQLREAEAALAARAADLAAAAGEASDAARVAGEDLARQIARLETAGVGVHDQMRLVEAGLSEQRAALVTVSHAIRADQEDFAAQAETRTAQLGEFMAEATHSAASLGDSAAKGGEALSGLLNEAAAQMKAMIDTAAAEREALAADAQQALSIVTEAAAGERARLEADLRQAVDRLADAADEARVSAEGHADAARGRVDQLNEAAFEASKKADAIFQARLDEARELIETSAQMVEQAGAKAAERLNDSARVARATVAELEALLDQLEDKTRSLPAAARSRAEEVKSAVEQSIDDLTASARRTAEETQAIDAAFQERIRRNYDMLSDAAKLIGVVAGGAPAASAALSAERPPPRLRREPAPEPPAGEGSRPRLRLTPTATDEEFRSVFETAGGRAPADPPAAKDGAGWNWKDLLTSIDSDDSDAEDLAERLVAEIAGMGIDPHALLSRARIDEIAAAVQTRDQGGAREVVRRLAPAATRRLVRRLFSDAAMRGMSDRYLRRFTGMLDEAAERDRGGHLVTSLLASDAGRAYLLLDAAAGDLA